MLRRRAFLGSGCCLLLLEGCGFHPIYAPGGGTADGPAATGLSQVSVALIPERSGQLLRQYLQARLERSGGGLAKLYDLNVSFSVNQEGVAISRADSVATRTRVSASASWSLISLDAERRTVTSGVARTTDGFNPLDNQYFYSDLQSEQTQRRVAEAVADQIAQQLAAWFSNHPATG